MKNKEYSWSEKQTDEIWRHGKFSSVEECIKDAIGCGKKAGGKTAIGICEDYVPYLSVNSLLEQAGEDAYEEVGEAAEDWPEFEGRGYKGADKLREKLDKVFDEWLKETNQIPSFYHIIPLEELVTIPEMED